MHLEIADDQKSKLYVTCKPISCLIYVTEMPFCSVLYWESSPQRLHHLCNNFIISATISSSPLQILLRRWWNMR